MALFPPLFRYFPKNECQNSQWCTVIEFISCPVWIWWYQLFQYYNWWSSFAILSAFFIHTFCSFTQPSCLSLFILSFSLEMLMRHTEWPLNISHLWWALYPPECPECCSESQWPRPCHVYGHLSLMTFLVFSYSCPVFQYRWGW